MGGTEVLVLLVFLALFAALAMRWSRVDDSHVESWARAWRLELTSDDAPSLRRYLLWSRRSRTIGALVGLVAPTVYSRFVLERPLEGNYELTLVFAGYLVGALAAEVVVNRPKGLGGGALLVPRRLYDYLPAHLPLLQRALGLLCLLLLGLYVVWPSKPADVSPSATEVAFFGIAGACLAAVVEALQRAIVARRQPIVDSREATVDDAMRSSSLHVIAAAGIALMLHIAGGELMVISFLTGRNGPDGPVGWVLLTCGVLLVLASVVCWMALTKPHGARVWRRGESVST